MSVWEDLRSLTAFAYRNAAHVSIMRRRRDWSAPMDVSLALWWVPDGHVPTVAEAVAKLRLIERRGSTADAFTFARPFGPDTLLAAEPPTVAASVG